VFPLQICACIPTLRPLFGDAFLGSVKERFSRHMTRLSHVTTSRTPDLTRTESRSEPINRGDGKGEGINVVGSTLVMQHSKSSTGSLDFDARERDLYELHMV
jgi:hypothetical protein